VKRILPFVKNKFIITSLVFLTYIIFIDDNDIFFITNQNEKLSELEIRNEEMKKKLDETKSILNKIKDMDFLEAYARETKFFKRDNEEIFVITYK
jgi:proteasome assembly chaperone (PAC2) family protein